MCVIFSWLQQPGQCTKGQCNGSGGRCEKKRSFFFQFTVGSWICRVKAENERALAEAKAASKASKTKLEEDLKELQEVSIVQCSGLCLCKGNIVLEDGTLH